MFVSDEAVPIRRGENAIYIRPKMSFGVRNKVMGEATRIELDLASRGRRGRRGGKNNPAAESGQTGALDVGAYQTALLVHNIVRWEGPAFQGVDCTPENIARLDPDEPLVEAVLEEISQRNHSQDPKNSTASGNGGTSDSED